MKIATDPRRQTQTLKCGVGCATNFMYGCVGMTSVLSSFQRSCVRMHTGADFVSIGSKSVNYFWLNMKNAQNRLDSSTLAQTDHQYCMLKKSGLAMMPYYAKNINESHQGGL